jgi:hypothetical protein
MMTMLGLSSVSASIKVDIDEERDIVVGVF